MNRNPPRATLTLTVALDVALAAAGMAGPAAAQEPAPDTLPAESTSAPATAIPLDPVRVTVLRTPLLASRAPFAVTVEGGTPSGAGLGLADVVGRVPGVQVDARYAFSEGDRISIRGFGARAQFGVRGVKVLVDGIPATLPDGQSSLSHVDPWLVRRAEVLRGPASALWGNAAGGVLQLETALPAPGVRVSALSGSHGLRRLAAEAGWGWRPDPAPTVRLGATASLFSWDGHREHANADKRFATVRGAWRGARDAIGVAAHAVDYAALSAGSLSAAQLATDRSQAHPFNVVQATGEEASQVQVGVSWRRVLDRGQRLSVSAWALARDLDNPIPPAIIELGRIASGVRVTWGSAAPPIPGGGKGAGAGPLPAPRPARATPGPSLDWTLGLDAELQSDDRINYENEGGGRGVRTLDQLERVAAVAPFAEVGFPLAGPLQLRGGLRWDLYAFEAEDRRITGDPDDSGSRNMSQLSPSVGLTADLGRAVLYGNMATSFQTPTTTELVNRPSGAGGFNPDLDPQRAVSFELGVRTRLGQGTPRAVVHLAAYRTRIDRALIPFEVADAPGRSYFRNAGSAVHRGMEVDAWLAPVPARAPVALRSLTLRLGFAWIDARFDDYRTDQADHSGSRIPGITPTRWTGSLSWVPPGGGRLELDYRRVHRTPVDDASTTHAPTYHLATLGAVAPPLRLAGVPLHVFAEVHNLFDRDYVSSIVVNAFGGRYFEPGPGRSLYLGVRIGAPVEPDPGGGHRVDR